MIRKGVVKFFNTMLGYGFASIIGEDRDVLVHYSTIKGKGFKNLKKGQEIEVEYQEKDGKLFATSVVAKKCSQMTE